LRLMNDARIAVGLQGLGLMEATLRLAQQFAEERASWGKSISKHEAIAEKLLDLEVDTKAFRSLCYQAASYQSLIYFGENRLADKDLNEDERKTIEGEVAQAKKLVRKWTPLIKWWVGEKSFVQARTCLQIHGGYGFTTEYRPEWWVRESLILSIYEGTSQIQALMCIKDTMKEIIKNPKDFVEVALGTKVQTLRPGNPLRRKLYRCKQLFNGALVSILMQLVKENVRTTISANRSADLLRLVQLVAGDLAKFEQLSAAFLHAERVCEMKSWIAMGHCLLRDAEVDSDRTWIAERFINRALPRLQCLKSEIEMDDPVIARRLEM